MALTASGAMAASSIYDLACQQVVGISSEITYSNFFGMTSSAAVSGSGFIASKTTLVSRTIIQSKLNGLAGVLSRTLSKTAKSS